jgi:hypothetical protein
VTVVASEIGGGMLALANAPDSALGVRRVGTERRP